MAAGVTPTTVNQQRAKLGHKSRDSVQRQQSWWLPYCILEFDLNEVRGTSSPLSSPCSLFLAGSHRPTRRKPRRTSLDVLGKFVRLSSDIRTRIRIHIHIRIRTSINQYQYPFPHRCAPLIATASRGLWQEPCSLPNSNSLRTRNHLPFCDLLEMVQSNGRMLPRSLAAVPTTCDFLSRQRQMCFTQSLTPDHTPSILSPTLSSSIAKLTY